MSSKEALNIIDGKLKQFLEWISIEEFGSVLLLIEERIRIIRGYSPGSLTFKEYVAFLNISDQDRLRLIQFRNLIAHGVTEERISRNDVEWLQSVIISATLRIKPIMKKIRINEEDILDKLARTFGTVGFKLKEQVRFQNLIVDAIVRVSKTKRRVAFEIKSNAQIRHEKYRSLAKFRQMLTILGIRHGVLVFSGSELHYVRDTISDTPLYFLIIGIENRRFSNILRDWTEEGNRELRKKSVSIDKLLSFWKDEFSNIDNDEDKLAW